MCYRMSSNTAIYGVFSRQPLYWSYEIVQDKGCPEQVDLNRIDSRLLCVCSCICRVRTLVTVSAMASLTCANLTASKSSLAGRRINCARGRTCHKT